MRRSFLFWVPTFVLFLVPFLVLILTPTQFIHPAQCPELTNNIVLSDSDQFKKIASFLGLLFNVLIGLVIWETFLRFVENHNGAIRREMIHWDRLPAFVALIILIIRFAHGNDRYFDLRYIENIRHPSPLWLIADAIYFLVLYCLFFLMTRALPATMWSRFYIYLFFIVAVDFLWELLIYDKAEFKCIEAWLMIDGASIWFVLGIIRFGKKPAVNVMDRPTNNYGNISVRLL